MFDALAAGFQAIAADRVLLAIVIGSAVLAAWVVYEVVSGGRRVRGDEREEPEPIPPPERRVEAIVQSLRERDARTVAKRRRKSRLVKAKARRKRQAV